MQILHPFAGSVAEYLAQLDNPDQYRPDQCPQCQTKQPLAAHGFYTRALIDSAFDGFIRVRRYLCESRRRRPISARSRGSAVFAPKPNTSRPRCPRSPIRRLR